MAKKSGIHIKPSHEGLLHKDLGVGKDKPIPAGKLEKATHSKDPAVKKRAVFAENAKHWHHGKKHTPTKEYHKGPKHTGAAKHTDQPHPKTNPGFYDTEPHAPKEKIADKVPIQNASLGNDVPNIVPKTPGRFPGVSGEAHKFKGPVGVSHGYGHAAHQRQGHLRMSGVPKAHRIGGKR